MGAYTVPIMEESSKHIMGKRKPITGKIFPNKRWSGVPPHKIMDMKTKRGQTICTSITLLIHVCKSKIHHTIMKQFCHLFLSLRGT